MSLRILHRVSKQAALFLIVMVRALSQTTADSAVHGIVTDPSGQAVALASVSIRNVGTGLRRTVSTESGGAYLFQALPPGHYEITVNANGFATILAPEIMLAVGQTAAIDFSLRISPLHETVIVTGSPIVERSGSASSQVLEAGSVQKLALSSRNFLHLTLLTPKVLPASTAISRGYMGDRYRENQFSFAGVRHQFNSQTIDGSDATVFTANAVKSFFSLESIQEFRVVNSLWTAEQGRAMGGIINVITRSGTDRWNGSIYEFLRNRKLDTADRLETPGFAVFRRNQFGAAGGGPLLKEKLLFFGNYEGQRQARSPRFPSVFLNNLTAINGALVRLGFPPETPNVLQTADSNQFFLRMDTAGNSRHRLMGRYSFYDTRNLRDRIASGGAANDPITSLGARNHRLRDQGVTLHLSSAPTAAWIHEAAVGFQKHAYRYEPLPGVPPVELVVAGAFSSGREGADELANGEGKLHLRDKISIIRGAHLWSFGGEYLRSSVAHLNIGSNLAVVAGLDGLLAPNPVILQTRLYRAPAGGTAVNLAASQAGFFVQDQWRLTPRLRVNAGLRYDVELIGGTAALSGNDLNNVQPRAGFAWSPDSKSAIRGGFGLYAAERYHALPLIDALSHGLDFPHFNEAFLAAHPFARRYPRASDLQEILTYVGDAALPALREFVTNGRLSTTAPAQQVVAASHPDTRSPEAWQWGIDIEREVRPGLAVAIGYSGLRSSNLPVLINRNLRPAEKKLASGKNDYEVAGAAAAARLYDPGFSFIFIAEPQGTSIYHGATFQVRKRFSRGLGVTANYVFSKNIDNTIQASSVVTPEDPLVPDRDRALSSEHAKHRLVTAISVETRGFSLNLIGVAQSPRYYNVTAGSDLNHDLNPNTDRPDALGRNTLRGDDLITLDVRLTRRFRLRERLQLQVLSEIFNVLNRVNVTDLNTVYGRPTLAQPSVATFNTPRAVGNAFQMQGGIKATF